MQMYVFKCWDCNQSVHKLGKNFRPPEVDCYVCGKRIEQDYTQKNIKPDVFEPYVETNMAGIPIEIATKKDREILCDKHKVTYDSWSPSQSRPKPQRKPWEKGLTWKVAQAKADR